MAVQQDTAYYYLNSANEIVMKVTWVETPANVIFIKPDGSQASGSNFQLADDAVSFTLYEDGSLESYRHVRADGSFEWLKFAPAEPGQGKVFGPNSEYTHGEMIYLETLTPDLVHRARTFENGKTTSYLLCFGSPETSNCVLTGHYDLDTGMSTVSLANLSHPTPITNTAVGDIERMNTLSASLISDNGAVLIGNDGSTLVGNDGASLIGNDGSTVSQLDVHALIGNDGSTAIGKDGRELFDLKGGGNSVVGPAYALEGSRLVGNDGSTLVGTDGATLAGNFLASVRGFSALSPTSFDDGVNLPVDSLTADTTTTGVIDIFGNTAGELETAGDRDWIKVELKAGETYAITVKGSDSGDGTLNDPHVKLYDSAGNFLVEDANGGVGANAELSFKPTVSGTYFVEAASSATGVGTYEIGVHTEGTGFLKSGPSIDSLTSMRFASSTSIVALDDGGYAIGFLARIDQQHDAPFNDSFHVQVEIIDADGQVVDLDARPEFSTMSPDRQPGSYFDNIPAGSPQMVADGHGGFTMILPDVFPFDFSNRGPLYRATVSHGSTLGMTSPTPITPADTTQYRAYTAFGVDIAMLANGDYIASMGRDGFDGTALTGSPVQVSINGASAVTVDAETGLGQRDQTTSVSALGNGAVVVWNDANADPAGPRSAAGGVLGAVLNSNGAVKFTFDVNQMEGESQFLGSSQAVAQLDDGGFVVAWMGYEVDPNHALPYTDCYLRVFNADGTPRSDEMLLGDSQAGGQSGATVIGLPAGGFAVAWTDGSNVRLQQFDNLGAKIGGEVMVGEGGGQSLSLGPDGKLAVAYVNSGQVRVQIMEANHAPTDILLPMHSVVEGTADTTTAIGTLSATDDNAGDTFTYELVDDAGGLFRIEGDKIYWNDVSHDPDFETQPSYEIRVKVTDSARTSLTKTLTIDVVDVSPVIDGGASVNLQLKENQHVAKTIVSHGDDSDAPTYSVVGGADAKLFDIKVSDDDAQLVFKTAPDFEHPADAGADNIYKVIIRADDGSGEVADQKITINVENVRGIKAGGPKLTGTDEEDDLTGTNGNDVINAKGGDDFLNGGRGRDTLTGGDGDDMFIFGKKLDAHTTAKNADRIVGFSTEDDGFILEGPTFSQLRTQDHFLASGAFAVNLTGKATDKFDRIIYEKDTGEIYFDADGNGEESGALLFAIIDKKLALNVENFEIG